MGILKVADLRKASRHIVLTNISSEERTFRYQHILSLFQVMTGSIFYINHDGPFLKKMVLHFSHKTWSPFFENKDGIL